MKGGEDKHHRRNPPTDLLSGAGTLVPANDLFVLELDDRLEFGLAILDPSLLDSNYVACNDNCNAYHC
jgi:hypothetical protein